MLVGGCGASPIRYHYPRNAGEVDGAIDRLELTIGCARAEGHTIAAHDAADTAIRKLRRALEQDPIDEPVMAAALDEAALSLDAVAKDARAAIPGAKAASLPEGRSAQNFDPMGQRDRLYDLENQAARAARCVRTLRRVLAGPPEGAG